MKQSSQVLLSAAFHHVDSKVWPLRDFIIVYFFSCYFQLDVLYFLNGAAATVYHVGSVNDGVAE